MTPANLLNQFGDTTYTKVFVGGLAWETQKETMRNYFEQFGEILEAVVITDKASGRSKGYGFVTFRDPDAASRACVDAAPVIDGRRANCNLASLGVQRSKPSTPKQGGRNSRTMGLGGFASGSFPHYAVQQGMPYSFYGYPAYSHDYAYPSNYYGVYGGVYGGMPAYYPYVHAGGGAGGYGSGQEYGIQYPHVYHYSGGYPHSAMQTGLMGEGKASQLFYR